MAQNEVQVELNLEIREAVKSIKKLDKGVENFTKDFNSKMKASSQAFNVFIGNVASRAAFAAFNGLTSAAGKLFDTFIIKGIDAAQKQQNAINRLNTQLAITGDFSEEASRDMQNFASSLQSVSKFGDEVILNQIALAKSFGASNDQAKQVAKTAADLSVSFGIDLESATRNVSKTLGGYAGELGEVLPELKNLTTEQLKAGEGIKLIASRFKGAATGEIKTFEVALLQLKNIFGDLKETFGGAITENKAIIDLFKALSIRINAFNKDLQTNNEVVAEFVSTSLVSLIRVFSQVLVIVDNVGRGFRFVGNTMSITISAAAEGVLAAVNLILGGFQSLNEAFGINSDAITSAIDVMSKAQAMFKDQVVQDAIDINETLKGDTALSDLAERSLALAEELQIKQVERKIKGQSELLKIDKTNQKKVVEQERSFVNQLLKIDEARKQGRVQNFKDTLSTISTLTSSSNKALFTIGKAGALAQAAIDIPAAVIKALASAPPPFNFALAAAVGAAGAVQLAAITAQKPPQFAEGGVVPGNSFVGDNVLARLNSGEQVLNVQERQDFAGEVSSLREDIKALALQPVVVEVDGTEIARAIRNTQRDGVRVFA